MYNRNNGSDDEVFSPTALMLGIIACLSIGGALISKSSGNFLIDLGSAAVIVIGSMFAMVFVYLAGALVSACLIGEIDAEPEKVRTIVCITFFVLIIACIIYAK